MASGLTVSLHERDVIRSPLTTKLDRSSPVKAMFAWLVATALRCRAGGNAQRPDTAGRLQQREGPRYSALINCLGRRLNGQEKAPAQD